MRAGIFAAALILTAIAILAVHAPGEKASTGPGLAYAADAWKNEFDDICSKTVDAVSLTAEELKNLIGRCDKLKPLMEKLDESQRKVYLRRLQQCKDLFAYVLESKEQK